MASHLSTGSLGRAESADIWRKVEKQCLKGLVVDLKRRLNRHAAAIKRKEMGASPMAIEVATIPPPPRQSPPRLRSPLLTSDHVKWRSRLPLSVNNQAQAMLPPSTAHYAPWYVKLLPLASGMTSSTCQWISRSHDNKGYAFVNMASFMKSIGRIPRAAPTTTQSTALDYALAPWRMEWSSSTAGQALWRAQSPTSATGGQ